MEKPTGLRRYIRPGDIIIFLSFLLIAIALFGLQGKQFTSAGENARIQIRYGGQTLQYPLVDDRELTVENNGVTLHIAVANGTVSVRDADCPDRLCQKTGAITKAGQSIVCLPCGCVITVQEGETGEVDVIVG